MSDSRTQPNEELHRRLNWWFISLFALLLLCVILCMVSNYEPSTYTGNANRFWMTALTADEDNFADRFTAQGDYYYYSSRNAPIFSVKKDIIEKSFEEDIRHCIKNYTWQQPAIAEAYVKWNKLEEKDKTAGSFLWELQLAKEAAFKKRYNNQRPYPDLKYEVKARFRHAKQDLRNIPIQFMYMSFLAFGLAWAWTARKRRLIERMFIAFVIPLLFFIPKLYHLYPINFRDVIYNWLTINFSVIEHEPFLSFSITSLSLCLITLGGFLFKKHVVPAFLSRVKK